MGWIPVLVAATLTAGSLAAATEAPTAAPRRLKIAFEQRTRGEALSSSFRRDEAGARRALALRTRLQIGLHNVAGPLGVYAELQDSRGVLNDRPFFVESRHTNQADVTQLHAHAAWSTARGTGAEIETVVRAGRFTLDVGNRRLVARNRMRNTTNAFDGALVSVRRRERWLARAFVTRPVTIEPHSPDSSTPQRLFWGVEGEKEPAHGPRLSLAVLGLREGGAIPARRRYTTLAVRAVRPPTPGRIDYEVESDWQVGSARGEQHRAHHQHVTVARTFPAAWQPRVSLHFDYASGDHAPDDSRSGTFDTLYGARRFELGPTGIYGPFLRANLVSPGLRWAATSQSKALSLMVLYRAMWLAESRDAWAGSGLVDPTGSSGTFLGHHAETQVRWMLSTALTLEAGLAHLFKGRFPARVLAGPDSPDPTFVYAEISLNGILLHR